MSDQSDYPVTESLGERELEVLSLLAQGKTNGEIATALVLSLNTVKWYARQIYGKLGVGNREEAAQRALALGLLSPTQPAGLPPHNLPAKLTPFVGRQKELARLNELLADPAVRLLTIVGPGGIGKTRLALQAALTTLHQNPETVKDGVYFVSLEQVAGGADVADMLAQILGLSPVAGTASTTRRLARYLHDKEMLLVLDNAEHLTGRTLSEFLDELLGAAPGVTVIATSRGRLDMRGEQLFWVEGLEMPLPETAAAAEAVERLEHTSSALALFVQTARRVQPAFTVTRENARSIIGICRHVQAMPLGIELAAVWMGLLSAEELLAELEQSPDILSTEEGNVPPGQRSMRAVFDTSWKLLAAPERKAVRALSVFAGGFTREAAAEICGLGLPMLLALVNKCWLKRDNNGRFSMHELLRQYGAEALAKKPEESSEVQAQHSAYYCRWLAGQCDALQGAHQQEAVAAVALELSNVRKASLAAVTRAETALLPSAIDSLGFFSRWQGSYSAGHEFLAVLLRELDSRVEAPPANQKLRARLLVWRSILQSLLGQYENSELLIGEAEQIAERLDQTGHDMVFERMYIAQERGYNSLMGRREAQEALRSFTTAHELALQLRAPWAEATTQMALARAKRNLRQLEDAEQACSKAIDLLHDGGSRLSLAEAIVLRGNILNHLGRPVEAIAVLNEELFQTVPHPDIEGYRLANLGWAHYLRGDFDRAEPLVGQSVRLYRENEIGWGMMFVHLFTDIQLQQGRYDTALDNVTASITLVPQDNRQEFEARIPYLRGAQALVQRQWNEAATDLLRSLAIWAPLPDWHLTFPNACLALAARQSGVGDAWGYLAAELTTTLTSRHYPPLIVCLLAAALLLADRGEVERAAELYYSVWKEPFAQNSAWLWEVAGRELDGVSANLGRELREAAQQQGEAMDLWATAAELMEMFTAEGE